MSALPPGAYPVQHCNAADRAEYRLKKLGARLGALLLSSCPDLAPKPPRMQWRTYRLAAAFAKVENEREELEWTGLASYVECIERFASCRRRLTARYC